MTLDFTISSEGVLAFASAQIMNPRIAASSNAYSVTVTATDGGGNTDATDVTINVADVNDNDPVLNVATSTVSATEFNNSSYTVLLMMMQEIQLLGVLVEMTLDYLQFLQRSLHLQVLQIMKPQDLQHHQMHIQ